MEQRPDPTNPDPSKPIWVWLCVDCGHRQPRAMAEAEAQEIERLQEPPA